MPEEQTAGAAAVEQDVAPELPAEDPALGIVGAADRALSPRQLAWRRFRRHKLAMFSAVVLAILALSAIFAKFVSPYTYHDVDILQAFRGPSPKHWFGLGPLKAWR